VAADGFTPGSDALVGRIGVGGKPVDLQTAHANPIGRQSPCVVLPQILQQI
jgi:hypothetical protein